MHCSYLTMCYEIMEVEPPQNRNSSSNLDFATLLFCPTNVCSFPTSYAGVCFDLAVPVTASSSRGKQLGIKPQKYAAAKSNWQHWVYLS